MSKTTESPKKVLLATNNIAEFLLKPENTNHFISALKKVAVEYKTSPSTFPDFEEPERNLVDTIHKMFVEKNLAFVAQTRPTFKCIIDKPSVQMFLIMCLEAKQNQKTP